MTPADTNSVSPIGTGEWDKVCSDTVQVSVPAVVPVQWVHLGDLQVLWRCIGTEHSLIAQPGVTLLPFPMRRKLKPLLTRMENILERSI
jgi:hypothetical protein